MKTLKIGISLMAIACLTLSGTSNDNYTDTNNEQIETQQKFKLLTHCKDKIKLPGNA